MDGNTPGLRPPRPHITNEGRTLSVTSTRSTSSLSTTSNDSQTAAQTAAKRMNNAQGSARPAPTQINMSQQTNFSRPAPPRVSLDDNTRSSQRAQGAIGAAMGHRPRQHSQGFFEPSLPTASASTLSASAIAAATAMNHLGAPTMSAQDRKRSIPNLAPINVGSFNRRSTSPTLPTSPQPPSIEGFLNSASEEGRLAATSAANAAYPKSPGPLSARPDMPPPSFSVPSLPDKPKEKSKMKLFSSKPKNIAIIKDKDADKRLPALPSPSKRPLQALQTGYTNASTTSLIDSSMSSATSLYSSANNSTSTLVPHGQSTPTNADKEKDKHRPHFLSRQKKSDKTLMLSSASSNSQAVDPSAPSSLYSFAPQSPGINSAFSKSMTGFDLRHGGKGLRDRRKEEKAASSLAAMSSSINLKSDYRNDSITVGSFEAASYLGPSSGSNANVFSFDANPTASAAAFNNLGTNMGLSGITPDDAWPLLKARLLNIFEGEQIRTPVEDFNLLVSVHIRRCVQKRAPHVLVEDLREFLFTGFTSLAQTLRSVPDDRLVPNLVEMWQLIYRIVLPFIQAVFLPLDLEFRGRGTIMTSREAADFWGAMPDQVNDRPSSAGGTPAKLLPGLAEELDVRRMTLISFRDTVIMPRHEALLNTFSRLSLDSINAAPSEAIASRSRGVSNAATDQRPNTSSGAAGAGSLSPRFSSYSSQTSTLLDATQQASPSHLRSRATSNTSAGSFGTSLPHIPTPPLGPSSANTPPLPGQPLAPPTTAAAALLAAHQQSQLHSRTRSAISVPDPVTSASLLSSSSAAAQATSAASWQSSTQLTATVARMLQCTSILASVQTGDVHQSVLEGLTGAIKHNWLGGRGRTGRQRMGFVGMRVGGGGSSVSTAAGGGTPVVGAGSPAVAAMG